MYVSKCRFTQMASDKMEQVLVFHLKRFSNSGRFSYGAAGDKIDSFVDAPVNGLDMRQFVKSSAIPAKDLIYDLHAISNHFGGLGGGHCIIPLYLAIFKLLTLTFRYGLCEKSY